MPVEWETGTVLEGRWEIRRILRGGMGVVYVVHDREWRQILAAKTFQDAVFARNREAKPLFLTEAQAWVRLDRHPNITQALFALEIAAKPLLFLEYIDGGDLSAWIGTPRLLEDKSQLLRLAISFCDGILHARAHGVEVHRDIKPQNCLITTDGRLKITDFGLAKTADGVEAPGRACGTPAYMPPEQFIDASAVDVRADIYSFGVMLYQMETGRLPFAARGWDAWETAHRETTPPVEAIPTGMREVIERCLAKDPARRWPDFAELRVSLAAMYFALTGTPPPRTVASPELEAGDWSNKGASLRTLGLPAEALDCYEKSLALSPYSGRTWTGKGTAMRDLGRPAEALSCFDRALDLDPSLALAWHNKGLVMGDLGRLEEKLACHERAIELDPNVSTIWTARGSALKQSGQAEKALESFDRAIRLDSRNAAAWANKGEILRRAGNLTEALDCTEKATEYEPHTPVVWLAKGEILRELDRAADALPCYRQALKLNPKFTDAWAAQGNALLNAGDPSAAAASFAAALQLDPQRGDLWSSQGLALGRAGRADEALSSLRSALQLLPYDADVRMRAAEILRSLNRYDEAEAAYQVAAQLAPENALIWHNRGVLARAAGRLQDALAHATRAVELDPTMPEAWLGKGNYQADLGMVEEAIATYDRLITRRPDFASAWISKGATLGNEERFAEALVCFERAAALGSKPAADAAERCRKEIPIPAKKKLSVDQWLLFASGRREDGDNEGALDYYGYAIEEHPANSRLYYTRGYLLEIMGRDEEAIADYKRAVEITPDWTNAWLFRGELLEKIPGREEEARFCLEQAALSKAAVAPKPVPATAPEPAPKPKLSAAEWYRRGQDLVVEGGKPAEALECFENTIAADPKHAPAWWGKALMLGELRRHDEMMQAYQRSMELDPNAPGPWVSLAAWLYNAKRYQEALVLYEEARKLGDLTAWQGSYLCREALGQLPSSSA